MKPVTALTPTPAAIKAFVKFINERHMVYLKKTAGSPKPWTSDPMLRKYRFTNVYRELDTVTCWITDNWRTPFADDPNLWFAMVVARLVNMPETLEAIEGSVFKRKRTGAYVHWEPELFVQEMHRRRDNDQKVFSSAYIVSTNGYAMDKAAYLAQYVLTPLWAARGSIVPQEHDTLAAFHTRLLRHNGLGSFMAAQVVADVKYVWPLNMAADWAIWAASGPGSRRGLNVVCGRDASDPWTERTWLTTLQALQGPVNLQRAAGTPYIHAQDLQNCLCEYSKYTRGYSRQLYRGI